jgi:hypothetical protein
MSDHDLFDALAGFFDDIPEAVRTEIAFVLVTLASDGAIEPGSQIDYEQAARDLFNGETRFGRLGNLISAAAVIDVYFAGEPQGRFAAMLTAFERRRADRRSKVPQWLGDRYAAQVQAIENARDAWAELRRSVLAPAAISAALTPGMISAPAASTDRGRAA